MSGCVGGACQEFISMMTPLVFYCCHKTATSTGAQKKNTSLLAHCSICQTSWWAGLVFPLQVSQGQSQGVSQPGLSSGGTRGESAPMLIWVFGRISSFMAIGLSFCFFPGGCRSLSQPIKTSCISCHVAPPSSKPATAHESFSCWNLWLLLLPQFSVSTQRKSSAWKGSCD